MKQKRMGHEKKSVGLRRTKEDGNDNFDLS